MVRHPGEPAQDSSPSQVEIDYRLLIDSTWRPAQALGHLHGLIGHVPGSPGQVFPVGLGGNFQLLVPQGMCLTDGTRVLGVLGLPTQAGPAQTQDTPSSSPVLAKISDL